MLDGTCNFGHSAASDLSCIMPCELKSVELTELEGASDTERALLRRIREGESELFYDLVRPCERAVYGAVYAVVQNEADAEEVAQEAVLKAFSNLHQFRGESRFSTWLVRIAINEARTRARRNRLRAAESLDEAPNDDAGGDYTPICLVDWREIPSDALQRSEVRELLARALASLSQIYREVVMLRDVQQLSISETATILGISQGSVKTRLLRARLQLRDVLAKQLGNNYTSGLCEGKKLWRW